MKTHDLKSLYVKELQEACSFEAQIAEALPSLANKTTDPSLEKFLKQDVPMTHSHCKALSGLLELHSADPEGHKDGSMEAILAETRDWADTISQPEVRDAALIASLQRMCHYKVAVYGTLVDWAERLDGIDDAESLRQLLEEEEQADAKLTEIAREAVNRRPVA